MPSALLWNRDIDGCAEDVLVARLASVTNTPLDRANGTLLREWVGVLFEEYRRNEVNPWLNRLGIMNRKRTVGGLQWCPYCLAADDKPYYRRHWRLGFVTSCLVHEVQLNDRCHVCATPSDFHHRTDEGCSACGTDRRSAPVRPVLPRVANLQRRCLNVLNGGVATLDGETEVHPLAFFGTLHRVFTLAIAGAGQARFRDVLAATYGGDPGAPRLTKAAMMVEVVDVTDRHRLLDLVAPLLADWPGGFVDACLRADIGWALVKRNTAAERLPYAIARPAREQLFRRQRGPTRETTGIAVSV